MPRWNDRAADTTIFALCGVVLVLLLPHGGVRHWVGLAFGAVAACMLVDEFVLWVQTRAPVLWGHVVWMAVVLATGVTLVAG